MDPVAQLELVPITPFIEANELPQFALPLDKGSWQVRAQPCDTQKPTSPKDWFKARMGDLVRVPLIPYRTRDMDLAQMLGDIVAIYHYLLTQVPAAMETHIMIGTPVERLDEHGCYRVWLGFAARIR